MKKLVLVLAAVLMTASASSAFAQFGPNREFSNSNLIIGPRIAPGAWNGLGIGANIEYGVTPQIGVTAMVGYSGYTYGYVDYSWTYSQIPIIVGANYHFDLLKVNKLDTYAGLGIGYNIVSVTTTDARYNYSAGSYFIWDFRVGGRYYFADKIAGTLELGYGFGFVRLGVDFKL